MKQPGSRADQLIHACAQPPDGAQGKLLMDADDSIIDDLIVPDVCDGIRGSNAMTRVKLSGTASRAYCCISALLLPAAVVSGYSAAEVQNMVRIIIL